MMSLLRASEFPFVFERVFPEAWQHVPMCAWLDHLGIGRSDLVESDWGYIEKPYRGQGMALLLFAGMMFYAHQRGYAACVGIPNETFKARFPPNVFHGTGLVTHLAGVRYELGLHVPPEIATIMSERVHTARVRDPRIVWQLPVGNAAP